MLPLPIGTIIKTVAALIIVVLFAVGFWWITGLRADLAVSQVNTKKLNQAIEQQQAAIEQMREEQEQIRAMAKAVNDQVAKQINDVNALRDRFNTTAGGQQRDWGRTASEKPAAVERAVNRGTVNALRCLEIASGAPLTEAEKNATKPEEINRECPAIANPLYRPAGSR
jgi:cell division protein FtsB